MCHLGGWGVFQAWMRSVLMQLKGSPVTDFRKKVTSDVYSDTVPLFQLDRPWHPHRTPCHVGVDPVDDFLLVLTVPGMFEQNHRLGVGFRGGEGHLGVQEVEAVLLAEDGVVLPGEVTGVAALRSTHVHPGLAVICWHMLHKFILTENGCLTQEPLRKAHLLLNSGCVSMLIPRHYQTVTLSPKTAPKFPLMERRYRSF